MASLKTDKFPPFVLCGGSKLYKSIPQKLQKPIFKRPYSRWYQIDSIVTPDLGRFRYYIAHGVICSQGIIGKGTVINGDLIEERCRCRSCKSCLADSSRDIRFVNKLVTPKSSDTLRYAINSTYKADVC
ncbi:hypothetical protein H106_03959 [Trichophyton rubrum CBS 735.88]|nr:hypothetical protein H106_03959 [Trichophyton rubrum CBS 735.88]